MTSLAGRHFLLNEEGYKLTIKEQLYQFTGASQHAEFE